MSLDRFRELGLKGWLFLGGCFLLLCVLVVGGYVWGATWEYSEGHRDGYVQKMSKPGFIWKTWEGELAMPGFGGSGSGKAGQSDNSNIWSFSVKDDKVAEELNKLTAAQFVRLTYKERFWSLPWDGSTTYFVVKVEPIEGDTKIPDKPPDKP